MKTQPEGGFSREPTKIVMLCDWLPPDFGAVGQYAVGFARELAEAGHDVALIGFSSEHDSCVDEAVGDGGLRVRRLYRPAYNRSNLLLRAWWTLGANLALLWGARRELRRCDEIQFTGSPPYLLHFVMPLAQLLRVRTRYRITDFHPECLIAAVGHSSRWLRALGTLTNFWRRRVGVIEVLGEDQGRRLVACGIDPAQIVLRRDPSPVAINTDTSPENPPEAAAGRKIILYSGNWGVAHDHETFVEGYRRFCLQYTSVAWLWLNATGKRAETVAEALQSMALPFGRTDPVALERLAGVLCAADLHLITLDDAFVGYVMPSKVYACIASERPILFIGSEESDVHLLCSRQVPLHRYCRVDPGDAGGVSSALEQLLGVSLSPPEREQVGDDMKIGSSP
ncbi:MAG: hypothetical protein M3451_02725 [Chloroflexota bacterium]|nr:hypothetical protein [Chloroflexota bacterium]